MSPHDAATLITAITTAVVAVSGIVKFLITRSEKKMTALVGATRTDLLRAIAHNMERQFEGLDKATYVTLDYRMDGDIACLRIPIAYNRVTECLQGMRLQLVDNSHEETVYSISTLGHHAPIRLHWHYHEEMELVQVIRGAVVDVSTGRRYTAGEVWVIEPGIRHIADFDSAYVLCTVRPPLPFASQCPMNLDGIVGVYDSIAPKA